MRSIALQICTFRLGKSKLHFFNFQVYTVSKRVISNVYAANSQVHYMHLNFLRRKLLCVLDKDSVCAWQKTSFLRLKNHLFMSFREGFPAYCKN